MRFIISGKNLDVTDSMRKAVTEKLGKLERYFTPETTVYVTMSVEKERQKIHGVDRASEQSVNRSSVLLLGAA